MRSQGMFDFRGSNAPCQRTESTMRRRVGISADYGTTGQRGALLGTDHVHDALTRIPYIEIGNTKIRAIACQRIDLELGEMVAHRDNPRGSRHIVVDCR